MQLKVRHIHVRRPKNKGTLVFHGLKVSIGCDLHLNSTCRNTCTTPVEHTGDDTGFIQVSMSKIQGLFQELLNASPTVFKDLNLMKNTD